MSEATKSQANLPNDYGIVIPLSECVYGYEGIALNDLGRISAMRDDDEHFVLQYLARENRTIKYRFALDTELEVRGGSDGCFVMRDVDGNEHMLTLYYHTNASEMAAVTPGQVAAHVVSRQKRLAMSEGERNRYDAEVGKAWDRSRQDMAAEKFDTEKFRACEERLKIDASKAMQQYGIVRPPPAKPKRKKRTQAK